MSADLLVTLFYIKPFLSCHSAWIEMISATHLTLSKTQNYSCHLMEPVNLSAIVSMSLFQHKWWVGDSKKCAVQARRWLQWVSNRNSGGREARWSRSGCRQLAASWVRQGQLLLAEGRWRGRILLIHLGGMQGWRSTLSRNYEQLLYDVWFYSITQRSHMVAALCRLVLAHVPEPLPEGPFLSVG